LSQPTPEDLRWLDAAARMASPWLGTTAENPTVAALVVDPTDQVLVARAVTAKGGRPHAEALALEEAGAAAHGMTLYVTLEPCHHWGRTPPCVDAVIRAGVARVVVGTSDPDPRTSGESLKRLAAAGIEVILTDHAPSKRLHAGHVMRQRAGRPFVTLKLAVSADGMVGRRNEGNVAITGEAARDWTHMQRALSDAVLVGGRTAMLDDPKLTVRLPGLEMRTPLRVVLSGAKGLDRRLNLIGGFSAHRAAIIAQSDVELDVPVSVEVIRIPGKNHRPDLMASLQALGTKGIQNLLVEAGAGLAEPFLAAGLVDRFELLTSDAVIGKDGLPATANGTIADRLEAAGFIEVEHRTLGNDMLRTLEPRSAPPTDSE
jgi:diaminohydroxyphosphoribosylaminopyrimidine deaminase / 5-amino-6-(5-phosphoribosylamino)uracil reductase